MDHFGPKNRAFLHFENIFPRASNDSRVWVVLSGGKEVGGRVALNTIFFLFNAG